MPGPSSRLLPNRRPVAGPGRWLLLGAVVIGLLTLQVLSGHDAAGHHRFLAAPPTAVQSHFQTQSTPTSSPSIEESPGHGHAIVAGCSLLLLAAAVVALGLAQRRTDERRPPQWSIPAGRLRGPPLLLSRRALCVERI